MCVIIKMAKEGEQAAAIDTVVIETKKEETEAAPAKVQVETRPTESNDLSMQYNVASQHFKSGLKKVESYTPFLYGIGSRVVVGAAWGGAFGLLFFSSRFSRKFSLLYGAGFGLGMCAPTIKQLHDDFSGIEPLDEQKIEDSMRTIKQEIELRKTLKQ